jgi:zinc and cadmium transporter
MWNNGSFSKLSQIAMSASPQSLLLLYCLGIAVFSLVGGYLPTRIRMTHTRMQLVMSIVSGLMLGVAFYHLLPHSIAMNDGHAAVDFSVWWLMLGLIAMLLMLRLFHFHEHDFSEEHAEAHDHHHDHIHAETETSSDEGGAHRLSWVGLGLGLGLHTLIDGIALGAIMRVDNHVEGVIGIGVFLAILLHKPLDSMSIVTVMQAGGWSKSARNGVNLLFALMCPLGALLFYFGVEQLANAASVVSASLAFSAGAFICIALSDLLPEVHFHSHDRLKLTLSFLLGIALAYAIGSVEPAGIHVAG